MLENINTGFYIANKSDYFKEKIMAKCEICGKSVQFGCSVSHSHKKINKMWRPNIKKIRVVEDNRTVRKNVCTSCIRSGAIQKAV